MMRRLAAAAVALAVAAPTAAPALAPPGVPGRLEEPELGDSLRRRWSNDPRATARRHADADEPGNFGAGLLLGFFLSLPGVAIAGVTASGAVDTPRAHRDYSALQERAYHAEYVAEVKAKRTRTAVLGGLVGALLGVAVIAFIASEQAE